ncbi:MAG: hypothetical protein ACXVDD_25080, partial [Polyangia bacterium]
RGRHELAEVTKARPSDQAREMSNLEGIAIDNASGRSASGERDRRCSDDEDRDEADDRQPELPSVHPISPHRRLPLPTLKHQACRSEAPVRRRATGDFGAPVQGQSTSAEG